MTATKTLRIVSLPGDGIGPEVCGEAVTIAIDTIYRSVRRITELRCTLGNRIEHRLKVSRRAGDHTQDVARRRLPRERLVEGALH